MYFPVSGVETPLWQPPLVAFCVSFFTSMGGVSGAFLLLPFQMSVLGYSAPSVSATNQVFNIVAIPSGVYRYMRERRMVWPLTWAVILGTLPGVFLGAWVRVNYLPNPRNFKLFAGLVLLYIGGRLLLNTLRRVGEKKPEPNPCPAPCPDPGASHAEAPAQYAVTESRFSMRCVEFHFMGQRHSFSPTSVFLLCFVVGLVGGIYGIGGGAIVAPFFVAIFHLPVHAVAGASLMGTFITSVAGVSFYSLLARYYPGLSVAPDWQLGALFGIGGIIGMYLGARLQRHVPARIIKYMLCVCLLYVGGTYVLGFLLH